MPDRYLVSFEGPAPDGALKGELASAGAPIGMQYGAQGECDSVEMTKHQAVVWANSEDEVLAIVEGVLEGKPYSRFEVTPISDAVD